MNISEVRALSRIPSPLRVFLLVSFVLNVMSFGSAFFAAHVLHMGEPYCRVLLSQRGYDLYYIQHMSTIHTYAFFPPNDTGVYRYPAAVAPFYLLFHWLPHPRSLFELMVFAICLVSSVVFAGALKRKGVPASQAGFLLIATWLMSYTMWFEFIQENMEIFIFLFLALAIWCFVRKQFAAAAIFIGLMGAMKLYPLIFLGLFLPRRKYGPIVLGLTTTAIATLASLVLLTPSISYSWHGVSAGLNNYSTTVIQTLLYRATNFDHSLFTLVKYALHFAHAMSHVVIALRIYILAVAVACLVLYVARVRFLPLANQILYFVLACVFLSPSSFDYTLIHLYVPWAMLVYITYARCKEHIQGMTTMMIWMAIMTTAQSEFIHHGIAYGGQIKAIFIPFMFWTVLCYPFEMPEFDGISIEPAGLTSEPAGQAGIA